MVDNIMKNRSGHTKNITHSQETNTKKSKSKILEMQYIRKNMYMFIISNYVIQSLMI